MAHLSGESGNGFRHAVALRKTGSTYMVAESSVTPDTTTLLYYSIIAMLQNKSFRSMSILRFFSKLQGPMRP